MTVSTKIGFGPKVVGKIMVLGKPGESLGTQLVDQSAKGKILLLCCYVGKEFLEKADLVGVRGIIVPSMHFRDCDSFQKTGEFSLLVLTKFGKLDISAELAAKLSKLDGKEGQLDGDGKKLEA